MLHYCAIYERERHLSHASFVGKEGTALMKEQTRFGFEIFEQI